VFVNKQPLIRQSSFSQADRLLRWGESLKSPYQRRQNAVKTVEHWGQRKLFLSELEFLTQLAHLG